MLSRVLSTVKHCVNRSLHLAETRPIEPSEALRVIFIIGPPRSGSTLLYQLLVNALDIGYIANLHAPYYGGISFRERFRRRDQNTANTTYDSRHGVTSGRNAPHECGAYWYQFFRRKPQFVPLSDVQPCKMELLRNSLTRIHKSFRRPVIFKNLNCALRLEPLLDTIPESLFIVTHRNEIDNAHSLLEGRYSVHGNYDTWWSMEPPTIESLRKQLPHQQVLGQIRDIHSEIDRHRTERFLDMSYEDVCRNPEAAVATVREHCQQFGIFLQRSNIVLPVSFQLRQEVRIDRSIYEALCSRASSD